MNVSLRLLREIIFAHYDITELRRGRGSVTKGSESVDSRVLFYYTTVLAQILGQHR
jgi:hypothetical protein